MTNRRDAYLIEKKRATAIADFYKHRVAGLVVCVVVTLVSLGTYPNLFWAICPLLVWVTATFINYAWVFVLMKKSGTEKRSLKW